MAYRKAQPSIGIDLGSSYCCVGTWKNHAVEIIPNDLGERTTPSFVAFTDTEKLVGTAAKNQASRNAENTVCDIMRLIGRKYDEPTLQSNMKLWPFKIVRESNGRIAIELKYKKYKSRYFPEEILSMILLYLKKIAEEYLGYKVNNALLSVPVFFNDSQRQSVRIAGKIAGLNVLRVTAASTLASFPYGMNEMKSNDDEQRVLMFDLGGNSCDVSLLVIDDGVFETKAVAWATNVGGKDFDDILVDYFAKEFQRKYKSNCTNSKRSTRRLRTQCEKVKRTLSATATARIEVDVLYDGIDFVSSITRETFEELCMNYFNKCLEPITKALEDATMSKSDIDEIVLLGGSTRIPRIQQMIKQYFNGKDLCKSINPDESVAFGASVQAAILSGDDMGDIAGDILLNDCGPISLGIGIASNADDKKKKKKQKKEDKATRAIPSDFAKAEKMTRMIERSHTIPCKGNETFTTYEDNQSCMLIQVYEGEHELTKDNKLVGQFVLRDIPPAPKGVPQIQVTFDVDANNIISVTAMDKKNPSNNAKIVVDCINVPVTDDEIKWVSLNLERWAAEDEEKRKTLRIKNDLENAAYKMRDELMDEKWKDIINDNDKKKVQDAVREIIDWIDANPNGDTKQYESKRAKLENIWKEIVGGNDKNDENGNEELLRLELIKQKDIIQKLTEQNTTLQSENNNLRNMLRSKNEELNNLQDDYKELEIKLKEKQKKSGYKSWDFNDVFEWIINIENQRFKKYQQKLFNKLKEERIDGTCLEEMDVNDLHRLGITEFKDKKALIKHIKDLTTKNKQHNNDNNIVAQDEGAPTAYL